MGMRMRSGADGSGDVRLARGDPAPGGGSDSLSAGRRDQIVAGRQAAYRTRQTETAPGRNCSARTRAAPRTDRGCGAVVRQPEHGMERRGRPGTAGRPGIRSKVGCRGVRAGERFWRATGRASGAFRSGTSTAAVAPGSRPTAGRTRRTAHRAQYFPALCRGPGTGATRFNRSGRRRPHGHLAGRGRTGACPEPRRKPVSRRRT